jgi:drug/metabolite transporter (DMT)-like permease
MSTYYFSIAALPLPDAVTLFFLNPAVTSVAAAALLREPLGALAAAGCCVSLAGLVLQAQPPALFHTGEQARRACAAQGLLTDHKRARPLTGALNSC